MFRQSRTRVFAARNISYAQFDYYLGRPVNAEDANGIVASGSYNDSLDRPKQIKRAIGTGAENQTSLDPNKRLMDIKTKQDAVVKSGNTNLFMVQGNQIRMDDANRNITFTQGRIRKF